MRRPLPRRGWGLERSLGAGSDDAAMAASSERVGVEIFTEFGDVADWEHGLKMLLFFFENCRNLVGLVGSDF
jgi:hypothetical protein